ncbi:MAG: hypothetical protein ACD_8C00144G0011 [uncultured bacterium]|nr:MAG: hypothetical protein ACD_8C00144G0011 [uncultured bacterium]
MAYEIENLILALVESLKNFYHSPFVLVVKILLGIYLAVLFVDILLLLILRDVPSHLRVGIRGMDIPLASKKKMRKRWDEIRAKLTVENNESQYKIAILEADAVVEEVLSGIGYKGANMSEKLDQVGTFHLDDHLGALRGAHEIRNRIINEPEFAMDQRMAVAVFGVYENFLEYLEYLN